MSKAKIIDWRAATPAPVVFISGGEEYLASRAIRSIREQLKQVDEALEFHEVNAADYESGQLLNLTSPSLFASATVRVCSMAQRMPPQWRGRATSATATTSSGAQAGPSPLGFQGLRSVPVARSRTRPCHGLGAATTVAG